jgi:hypothetical protein
MLPVLMLVGVGARRRVWIPLPMVLLWPFWFLGWGVWLLLWVVRASWARPLQGALQLGCSLSGLRVDVESVNGKSVHVRLI